MNSSEYFSTNTLLLQENLFSAKNALMNEIYNPEYVKDLFNKMSSSYERMNYITSFGFSARWRKQSLKCLKADTTPVEIIDLLSGMGETWNAIFQRYPDAQLTALDFSEGMTQYAIAKNRVKYNNKVTILRDNVLSNTLPSGHFDMVTCSYGLKTFDEQQLTMLGQEVARILKPGGQFTFVEVSQPANFILQILYSCYLKFIIPLLGKVFLADPTQYKMLWQYTNRFGNARRTQKVFESCGLQTGYASFFGGCATGIYGMKSN